MALLLLDRFLYAVAGNWVTTSGPDINDPASLLFVATQSGPSSMLVHNALAQPRAGEVGGALVAYQRPLPRLNGELLRYQAWYFEFRFIKETYDNNARFENDNKTCFLSRPNPTTYIRNIANGSTQYNFDSGEMQADQDPPGWKNIGWRPAPGVMAADVWHVFNHRQHFDEAAETFQIDSLAIDDDGWINQDPSWQNIPAQSSNWETVVAMQHQNAGYNEGTVLIEFRNGIMGHSDEPIGPGPLPQQKSYGR
jgi:hypothetical protein